MDMHVYSTREDFPPSLHHHIRHLKGTSFDAFHHPFLVDMIPLGLPDKIENVLKFRKDYAESRLKAGSASGYIFGHQRPYRMMELLRLMRRGYFGASCASSIRYWRLVSAVWMDAEEDESSLVWGLLLASPISNRQAMTNSSDRRVLRGMPDTITVFRGVQAVDEQETVDAAMTGYSWTLSSKTADFFAQRLLKAEDTPFIVSTQIKKADVIAYLSARGEQEILIQSNQLSEDSLALSSMPARRRQRGDLVSLQDFFAE